MPAPIQAPLNLHSEQSYYGGKVRDVYRIQDQLVIVVSDRISAFDHILPRPIPYKGQVLNQIAAHFLDACKDIVPIWLDHVPHPNVSIGKIAEPIKIEMVVRGYMAGHSWRVYRDGGRVLCGVPLPEGMKESDRFMHPIITPATKADEGHDEDISAEEILKRGIVTPEQWKQLCDYTLALFERGTEMAAAQGLILVDTKYEFGIIDGEIVLIDEIHTPDSSRYYIADGYKERQERGERQQQLSKEFVREWLMDNGFQGLEGQQMPAMPDDFVETVSNRYIDLYERLIGKSFVPAAQDNLAEDITASIKNMLKS